MYMPPIWLRHGRGDNNDKIRYCLSILNKMYYASSSDPKMTSMVTLRGYNDIESLK